MGHWNKKAKKKRSAKRIVVTVLLLIVGLIAVALGGFIGYLRLPMSSYYAASVKGFRIPGLEENFVPQGLHYDAERNHFLVGGYCSDHTASPVYIVRGEDGALQKTVRLSKTDGQAFCGHASGVAVAGDYMYVAGGDDRCLYVWSYADFLSVEDGGSISCLGVFSTRVSDTDFVDVSFVTVSGDRLFLGEFYDDPLYPTLDSHKMTTSVGDYHQAIALEYRLSDDGVFGIDQEPVAAYSLPDCVQGLAMEGDTLYLSISYGLSFSRILEYRYGELSAQGEISLLGRSLPLYAMDSAALRYTYEMPPMSEEIVMLDGRLYVMCESASNKYIFGKLIGGEWCYATDLEAMKRK